MTRTEFRPLQFNQVERDVPAENKRRLLPCRHHHLMLLRTQASTQEAVFQNTHEVITTKYPIILVREKKN
ncbi:unnamed protein product, partial [Iphiclides podalirius]